MPISWSTLPTHIVMRNMANVCKNICEKRNEHWEIAWCQTDNLILSSLCCCTVVLHTAAVCTNADSIQTGRCINWGCRCGCCTAGRQQWCTAQNWHHWGARAAAGRYVWPPLMRSKSMFTGLPLCGQALSRPTTWHAYSSGMLFR